MNDEEINSNFQRLKKIQNHNLLKLNYIYIKYIYKLCLFEDTLCHILINIEKCLIIELELLKKRKCQTIFSVD